MPANRPARPGATAATAVATIRATGRSQPQQVRLVIETGHRISYLLEGPLCQQAAAVKVDDRVCAPDGSKPVRDGDRGHCLAPVPRSSVLLGSRSLRQGHWSPRPSPAASGPCTARERSRAAASRRRSAARHAPRLLCRAPPGRQPGTQRDELASMQPILGHRRSQRCVVRARRCPARSLRPERRTAERRRPSRDSGARPARETVHRSGQSPPRAARLRGWHRQAWTCRPPKDRRRQGLGRVAA